MRRSRAGFCVAAFVTAGFFMWGCGGPGEQAMKREGRQSPTQAPKPTRAATGAWGRGFDAETNFPDHTLTLVGTSWVQLDPIEEGSTTIVVGIEPGISVDDLSRMIEEHRQEFDSPPLSRHRGSGTVHSDVLGEVNWSWANFDSDGVTMTQLAVFAGHPNDDLLLLGRSEFPSDSDDIQPQLQELVRATEIIGPGL